jgi:hypothetical protein
MINIEIVIYFHAILIDEFGGSNGISDNNAPKAAIQRHIPHLKEKIYTQLFTTRPLL